MISRLATRGLYLSHVGTIGPISEISGSSILVLDQPQRTSDILHAVDYKQMQFLRDQN
jgi:hypothetical protein